MSQRGFSIVAGGDTAAFTLDGGHYGLLVDATNYHSGSVALQIEDPAGAFVTVGSAVTSGNSYVTADLPPGSYRALLDFSSFANTTTHDATATTDAATLSTDTGTAATDIAAIPGVHAAALALSAALVAAVATVSTDVAAIAAAVAAHTAATAHTAVTTAQTAVTAAQSASSAAQADPDISGDTTSMTALGTVDSDLSALVTILGTLATDTGNAPAGVNFVLSRVP